MLSLQVVRACSGKSGFSSVVFCFFGVLLVLFASASTAAEYRAFWVDGWGAGFLNQSQVDTLLGVPGTTTKGQIRDANCNAVIVQVRRRFDVSYPSGVGEPYMSGLSPANFNALAAMIKAAHDTTGGKKRIEVHCWSVAFKTGKGTVYAQHSDAGNPDNYWPTRIDSTTGAENSDGAFDSGHPKVLQYLVNAHMDLVNFQTTAGPGGTDGHIDGIHYDYIRFEANNEGFNPTSVARYNARYGLTGEPSASDESFKQWRRDQVTAFVRQMYARIQKTKPWIRQSGSFVTWNPSPTTSTRAGFQATRPYYDVYSDWDSWMQEGIVDMAVPMTYYSWASLPTDYTRWMNFEKDRKFNRHMIIGPGTYMNSLANAILELQMTRDASPAGNRAHGFSGYSYRVPYASGTWAGFSPSLVSQVTPTWEEVPAMPWKTAPTNGHLMGVVTLAATGAWADHTVVNLAGPVSRSQYVDGTGFYAFIDLPPGSYAVAASKAGFVNATGAVTIAVGAVTGNMYECNLTLNTAGANFTLNVSATAGGAVSRNPDLPSYAPNSTVTLTATPDTGFAFTGWSGDASGATNPLSVQMTGNKMISASFASTVTDIILDNPNPAATYSGTWIAGTMSTDKYGSDYRFATTAIGGTATATFQPNIGVAGYYDVYLWYPQGSNRATNAPWSVVYNGGSTNVTVDQTGNGGGWRLIAAARPFALGTNGYVRLSNNCSPAGKVVMADAVRLVYVGAINTPPAITAQPQSFTVNQGGNAGFNVLASGSPKPGYQWRFNGTNLAGATVSSITITNAQPTNAGSYSVLVSNVAGNLTSSNAMLTVHVPPAIETPPQSQSVKWSSNATFTFTATGTEPLNYQWHFKSAALAGATAASFTRTNVQDGDAGDYSVTVTNMAGSTNSVPATLTVIPPQPARFEAIGKLPDGRIQLLWSGETGWSYTLQGSTDVGFLDSSALGLVSGSNGWFGFVDDESTNLPQRFYRTQP